MRDPLAQMQQRLAEMSPAERENLRRHMTGDADEDLIRRGDVYAALRAAKVGPVKPAEVQRGIGLAMSAVMDIPARQDSEQPAKGEG